MGEKVEDAVKVKLGVLVVAMLPGRLEMETVRGMDCVFCSVSAVTLAPFTFAI